MCEVQKADYSTLTAFFFNGNFSQPFDMATNAWEIQDQGH